jgi:hypothetical protein
LRPANALVLLALVPIALWAGAPPRAPQIPSISVTVYDGNPAHVWNRLYAALRIREDSRGNRYGEDSLDPMLWRESEHLLSQPSHGLALHVLDEFLRTHAETLIRDPLKRAILQRDLWAVFDWSVQQYSGKEYTGEKRNLQTRLAEVLRRLALTPEQIKSLTDNYAQAVASKAFAAQYDPRQPQQTFLPPDLFDPRGPWVCISPSPDSISLGGVAKLHVGNFSGRSVAVSPITESVQIRVYREITTARMRDFSPGPAGRPETAGRISSTSESADRCCFPASKGG